MSRRIIRARVQQQRSFMPQVSLRRETLADDGEYTTFGSIALCTAQVHVGPFERQPPVAVASNSAVYADSAQWRTETVDRFLPIGMDRLLTVSTLPRKQ